MKTYLEMGIEHPGIILEAEGDTEADMLSSIWIRGHLSRL